jgi:hypothetical protein
MIKSYGAWAKVSAWATNATNGKTETIAGDGAEKGDIFVSNPN